MTEQFAVDQLEALENEFETAPPQEILRWAAAEYGDRLVVVTSFQPTGIVTLHMLSEIAPQTQILTLDTGLLFPETYALIDDLEVRLNLNLRRLTSQLTVQQQAEEYGDKLWERDPDQCCHMRKTLPLKDALTGYDAWITGLRRDQSTGRANTPIISIDKRYDMVKLCPFANWTEDMMWTYINAYDLPYNELHDKNYSSIGCYPCTRAVLDGEDPRSGRWSNHTKTECGIHIDTIGEKNE